MSKDLTIAEQWRIIKRQQNLLKEIHDDLVDRANCIGSKHVNLSDGLWIELCNILLGKDSEAIRSAL